MDALEQFLHNISYKFPKGYPNLEDKDDLALLENEFAKLGIDLNELTLTTHYSERKIERSVITDIPNLSQQMIGDKDFQETKAKLANDIEQELLKRLSYVEGIKNIPLSFKEIVVYKVLKPILSYNGEKYDLKTTTESSKKDETVSSTNLYYVVIVKNDKLITFMGANGDDSDLEQQVSKHEYKADEPALPIKILTLGDFEYVISLDEKSMEKSLIDPDSLPYKLRTDYRKGADFEHKEYGKGTIVTTSAGNSGKGDSRGMVEWVEVDFKKPYVAGGQLKKTRLIKNVYTLLSPDLGARAAE